MKTQLLPMRTLWGVAAAVCVLVCSAAPAQDSAAPDFQNRWYLGTNPAAPVATAVFNGHVGETSADPHVPQSVHYAVLRSQFGLPVYGALVSAPIVDSDGDGLPDEWEELYGLDADSDEGDDGADGDPDDDGATNLEEYDAETDPRDEDSDDDWLPDGWEIDYELDPLVGGSGGDDADDDTWSNIEEYYGGSDPRSADSEPVPTVTVLEVTAGTALVVGGSPISVRGVFLNAGCIVTVGGEPCTDVAVAKADGLTTLTAVAPPAPEGPADLVVEDVSAGTWDTWADAVAYTADPFDAGLDTTPDIVRMWNEGTAATLYAYLPDSGAVAMTTPRGTDLAIPAALRAGYAGGFVLVRDEVRVSRLPLDRTPAPPDGFEAATPAFDIGGLVFDGGAALEIDEPFAEPVTVTLPVTHGTAADPLVLGYAETHLGADLAPFCAAAPEEDAVLTAGAAPIDTDPEANTVFGSIGSAASRLIRVRIIPSFSSVQVAPPFRLTTMPFSTAT